MGFNRIFASVIVLLTITIMSGLLVFSVGCAKNDDGEIKIGVILPLTGPGAPYGQAEREGIELAINQFNAGGVVNGKRKIRLIIEDSKTEPASGVSAINKLIQLDKVKVVIGDLASSVTLAMAPIAESHKVLLITPGASNPKISDAGDYIFRLYPSDDYQGKLLAKWASTKGINQVGIIHINNDFGFGLKDKFKSDFERQAVR